MERTGSVQRCIHNLYVLCIVADKLRAEKLRLAHSPEFVVHFLSKHDKHSALYRFVFGKCFYIGNFIYFIYNPFVMRLGYLRTVIPIRFIAVVHRRIMRGGYNNAGIRFKFADCKRKFRSRAESREKISLYSVSRKNSRRRLCKNIGIISAVIGYNRA